MPLPDLIQFYDLSEMQILILKLQPFITRYQGLRRIESRPQGSRGGTPGLCIDGGHHKHLFGDMVNTFW